MYIYMYVCMYSHSILHNIQYSIPYMQELPEILQITLGRFSENGKKIHHKVCPSILALSLSRALSFLNTQREGDYI